MSAKAILGFEIKWAKGRAHQLPEVHRRGAKEGVDRVSEGTAELISVEALIRFEVSDRRFDSGAAFHPAPDRFGGFASLAFIHDHPVITSGHQERAV
jgi:hypothetical protein